MTKTIKRLLPAALAVLLAGCTMQPVDSTTARYRVALVAKNNRDSEFWDAVFTGAEAAATEYNLQLTITAPDDEEDYAAQNQLIADAVEDGAQAIVFSAIDYEANAAAIDAAAAAGVTIISVDSAVNSDNVAAYIGADNYGAGRMAAQSALDGMQGALCVGLINYEVKGETHYEKVCCSGPCRLHGRLSRRLRRFRLHFHRCFGVHGSRRVHLCCRVCC